MAVQFRNTKMASMAKEDEGTVAFPAWSQDSQFRTFSTMHTPNPTFRRIRPGESGSVSVAGFKDLRIYGGRWGGWTGITPDGSPLVVRDISKEEIYMLDVNLP